MMLRAVSCMRADLHLLGCLRLLLGEFDRQPQILAEKV